MHLMPKNEQCFRSCSFFYLLYSFSHRILSNFSMEISSKKLYNKTELKFSEI
ncbi:hypothetical protein D356_01073 [Enterococcus faecium SD2A-2]|uniref:Uncharacterized protein n=1 Tax=Enterococcus faecium SD2A-2 TaxID=1244154 RepID=A0AB73AAJ4_ENTFC|nr:hypothetical protein HMPREF1345_01222 [Enterococcus faecium TX1337RF]EPI13809.1 hypothetical protein D356_01073 [Enterococcus faecium SD2A-2]